MLTAEEEEGFDKDRSKEELPAVLVVVVVGMAVLLLRESRGLFQKPPKGLSSASSSVVRRHVEEAGLGLGRLI